MPITSVEELETRYSQIDIWLEKTKEYLLRKKDNNIVLSPLNKST